jgi:uncharacterized protein YjbI with pentapeptide repeats
VNGSSSLKIAPLSTNEANDGLQLHNVIAHVVVKASATVFLAAILSIGFPVTAAEGGASLGSNAKITTGGASTLQSGRTIAITRGVNLDNSDFSNQNLKGVAFQQSIVRDTNFKGTNLVGASFFDATLDGSDFEGADMSLANVEMAQFKRASLKVHTLSLSYIARALFIACQVLASLFFLLFIIVQNAIVKEMYVSGSTLFEGVKDISGSDWTDTELRKDQKKYLCEHPTATGTNPVTGVDTRESLMCPD